MTTAPTTPITAAFHGLIRYADAVMATSPASDPFMIVTTSGRPSRIQVSAMPASPPNVAATVVFRITVGTLGVSAYMLPPLKPYQPTQSTNTPNVATGRSWPPIETAPGPKRPIRGPRMMIAARATQPPTEWTTVDPA